jgi:ABC-type Fe3+-siderophore transport system permease subunit
MPRRVYTLAVLLCALSWLLVGLHVPALHDLSHADVPRRWLPLALLVGFFVLAVADTWALLRAPAPWTRRPLHCEEGRG